MSLRQLHQVLIAWIGIGILMLLLAGCPSPCPNSSDAPEITFQKVNKQVVPAASTGTFDSLIITLDFTDGSGNIGVKSGDKETNLHVARSFDGCILGELGTSVDTSTDVDTLVANAFLKDSRTGCVNSYRIPFIKPKTKSKCIKGEIDITKLGFRCLPGSGATDTLRYDIHIKDRDNNKSNTVTTPPIVIQCN